MDSGLGLKSSGFCGNGQADSVHDVAYICMSIRGSVSFSASFGLSDQTDDRDSARGMEVRHMVYAVGLEDCRFETVSDFKQGCTLSY